MKATTTTTKSTKENKDYLSKIKKETNTNKETAVKEQEDIAWDKHVSDDEVEEQTKTGSNIVTDQGKAGGNAPKSLKELLGSSNAEAKKPTTAKPKAKPAAQETTSQGGVNKPRFINSTGAKSKNTPLPGATVTSTATTTERKPVFGNSKGGVNNNTPLNPNAKVEAKKEENINDVKGKIANTKTLFKKTLDENTQVKAPTKDYLEGDVDVKYKAGEDVEIAKPVFQSKKAGDEPHFVDINTKEDLFLKNMSKAVNLDSDIVYSTPKEERENKKEFKPKKRNFDENRKERNNGEEPRPERTETKPAVEYDSDGFEIISEKKQGEKKKPYRKREYEENGNGEKKKFFKKENGEERPATAIKKAAAPVEVAKPKPAQNTNLNKVTILENTVQAASLKDLLK